MTIRADDALNKRDRAFTATFALLSTAMACAVVLIAVPRAVPLTLPTLSLPAAEVRAALAHDRELSARAPTSAVANEMYGLLLAAGEQELQRTPPQGPWQPRVAAITRRALGELGNGGIRSLRARATERFMLALFDELDDAHEARGLCGTLRAVLVEHGYLSERGRLIAPALSVRATYKARWNMIFGSEPSFDMSNIERVAYEGFRGLEARNMPPEQRTLALTELARAGGRGASEALAIWGAINGQPAALIAHARTDRGASELRMRNMAISVLSARRAASEN